MSDGHGSRYPERDRDDRQWQDRRDDYRSRQANFLTGRRNHSRSPSSKHSRGDYSRDSYPRERRDGSYGASHDRDSRSRYHRDPHNYENMYDDGQPQDDDQYNHHNDDKRCREEYQPQRSRHHRRSSSRSRSPTRDAGKPSDTVILEGLPFSVSSTELREIFSNNIASETPTLDVRISASKGQRRAFVQFEKIDQAIAFVREHFPKLLIELQHPTDEIPDGKFDAYIHYARSRDEVDTRNSNTSDWACVQCGTSNFATRAKCRDCGSYPSGAHWQQSLTGAADVGNTPSHMLVIYPLAPFVNEDMLANDIKKLELDKPDRAKDTSNGAPKLKSTAPTGDASGYGARPGSLHRVFLMRDCTSNESFKYGFAEFWTMEDAAAALTKFQKSRAFTVAACAVSISTIHMGVFVPNEVGPTPSTEMMSFHPLFNPSLRVSYRDPHVYPSQQVVAPEPPAGSADQQQTEEQSQDKKSKKRKADGSLAANAVKKPLAMAGKMAMWQQKHGELHAEGQNPDSKPSSNGLIKISLTNSIPLPPRSTDASQPAPMSDKTPAEARFDKTSDDSSEKAEEATISYVDRDRLMCLICMRKYKSVDEVNIHEKSRNHKTAMENPELVKAALPRLAIRDKRQQKQIAADPSAAEDQQDMQYRDRAKERRQAFNQPKKPSVNQPAKNASSAKNEGDAPSSAAAPKPAPSKGAGMLAKMGWAAGAGLGANGEGRTEAIATHAYQEGVGLGAEGSNLGDAAELADKKTRNSYAEYVNSVQDKARQRYNKLE